MKFAIVGAGGVGGYFGARLVADGNDVVFLARGAQRDAMAEKGLRVLSPLGDLHLEQPQLHQDPETTGLCDFILLCVKLWDLEAAAEQIRPLLSHDSVVVPLQNGVSAEADLARLLGPSHVMGGVARIATVIEEPGVIRHSSPFAQIVFGELNGQGSWRQDCLLSACIGAGIEAEVASDIQMILWRKFILLAPMAGAACFHRATLGTLLGDPEKRGLLQTLIAETVAVGRARGVALPGNTEERTLKALSGFQSDMKPSMLHDLEAGRRLELPWLNGEVARLGKELGVDTPASDEVTEALMPLAQGGGS